MGTSRRVVGSYKDLDEYDADEDRLVFADNEGIAFGAGLKWEIYSDGSSLCTSIPSLGLALDPDRLVSKTAPTAIVPSVASIPYTQTNFGHTVLDGFEARKRALYLLGDDGNGPQLVFAPANAPTSGTTLMFEPATGVLLFDPDGKSIVIGAAVTDKLAFYGSTAIVQPSHLVDPTDEAELVTYAAADNVRWENLGLGASS